MKICFFTQNRWAFGSIHHGLAKELWKHGIYANLLNWDVSYDPEEILAISDTYDVFVTQPDGVESLHSYGIDYGRIIAIAHGEWDILYAKSKASCDFYPLLKGFGVISNVLKRKCYEWEISRIPKIIELGIHTKIYDYPIPKSLQNIGYAGAFESKNWQGIEIKRGKLVENLCKESDYQLVRKGIWNHLAMPGYYKIVDAVVMSSIEEAGGLPMMECAAAGRLPMGTPVGYFEENAPKGGGVLLPLEESDFLREGKMWLEYYRSNSSRYRARCEEARDFARQNYDWSVKIKAWIDLLTT